MRRRRSGARTAFIAFRVRFWRRSFISCCRLREVARLVLRQRERLRVDDVVGVFVDAVDRTDLHAEVAADALLGSTTCVRRPVEK